MPNNKAFLQQLRNMPEYAQLNQFIFFFKRGLQIAEPTDAEILEEELLDNRQGRLTRQISAGLTRAAWRLKKKVFSDADLWDYGLKLWEHHRDEFEEAQLRDSREAEADAEADAEEAEEIEEPPAKKQKPNARSTRTRSSRSRASLAKQEEEEKRQQEALEAEEAEKEASKDVEEQEREIRRQAASRRQICPWDFNPFAESSKYASTWSRFDAFQLVRIWWQMIQWTMDNELLAREVVENTLKHTDYKPEEMRAEPIGWDADNRVYYLFGDSRLYLRTETVSSSGFDILDTDYEGWECVCATYDDWLAFMGNLRGRDSEYKAYKKHKPKAKSKQWSQEELQQREYESGLLSFLESDVFPAVTDVFLEKAKLSQSRDKERHLEMAMANRKTSSRIQALQVKREEEERAERKQAEDRAAARAEAKRQERIEVQRKQMEERQMARERRFKQREAKHQTNSPAPQPVPTRARRAATQPKGWTFDCICGVYGQNYEDEKEMIECETCRTWMHIDCIKSRRDVDTESFVCDVCAEREKREAQEMKDKEERLAREKIEEEQRKVEEEQRKVEEEQRKVEEEARHRKEQEERAEREKEQQQREKEQQQHQHQQQVPVQQVPAHPLQPNFQQQHFPQQYPPQHFPQQHFPQQYPPQHFPPHFAQQLPPQGYPMQNQQQSFQQSQHFQPPQHTPHQTNPLNGHVSHSGNGHAGNGEMKPESVCGQAQPNGGPGGSRPLLSDQGAAKEELSTSSTLPSE